MAENLYSAGTHCFHQADGIRIHAFVSVQKSDGDREKGCDHYQSDLRRHSKAHPQHQKRSNGDSGNCLGNNKNRVKRLVDYGKPVHQFFSGLRISAAYAVVGAVVSEWLGGFEGLGVYMTRVKKAYAFDKMFAVIVFISAISLVLMGIVVLLEKISMPWVHKKEISGDKK